MFCLDCRYDVALDINVRGAKHALEFAKQCARLEMFLHVSTGEFHLIVNKPLHQILCYILHECKANYVRINPCSIMCVVILVFNAD